MARSRLVMVRWFEQIEILISRQARRDFPSPTALFFRTLFEMGIRLHLKVGANPLSTFVGIYRGNRIGE